MKKIKLLAVFGNPVLHSNSPKLFNEAFEAIGMDWYYTRIRPQSAERILKIIKEIPLLGANITAPFKEDVFKLLDFISDDAKQIGAVNTILNKDGRLLGYNTDHYGVSESLLNAGFSIKNNNCLVLGAGGAARAAVYSLVNKGAEVSICNRTRAKAESISRDFGCKIIDWNSFSSDMEFDIVISTLLPEAEPCFLEDMEFDSLLDASYKGSVAANIAIENGARLISGEKWLLYQAAQAFKIFTEIEPPVRTMDQGFKKPLSTDNLKIESIQQKSTQEIFNNKIDLLIDANADDDSELKSIIDEEIGKAFAG